MNLQHLSLPVLMVQIIGVPMLNIDDQGILMTKDLINQESMSSAINDDEVFQKHWKFKSHFAVTL